MKSGIKDAVERGDPEAVALICRELMKQHGPDFLQAVKGAGGIPDPTSSRAHEFEKEIETLLSGITHAIESLDIELQGVIGNRVTELERALLALRSWTRAIANELDQSEFSELSPGDQLRTLCIFFEREVNRHSAVAHAVVTKRKGRLDVSDSLTSRGHSPYVAGSVTDANAIEAYGFITDFCLRYLLYKHKGKFGSPGKAVIANTKAVPKFLGLASRQMIVTRMWTLFKLRDWRLEFHGEILGCQPPSPKRFALEEVSQFREQVWETQHIGRRVENGALKLDRWHRSILKLVSYATLPGEGWFCDLPASVLADVLNSSEGVFDAQASEELYEFYRINLEDLKLGEAGISFGKVLIALKFVHTLAWVYHTVLPTWIRKFPDRSELLCPVVDRQLLSRKLAETGGVTLSESQVVLGFLLFDPKHTLLRLWQQPLIPWDDNQCILLPSVARAIDIPKFVERVLAENGYPFSERGPVFEQEVRHQLSSYGLSVVPHAIKFTASDGREVEYDLVALFQDHVLVMEAKCLRRPSDVSQRGTQWEEVTEGANQVRRRCELLQSDWHKIRELAGIALPDSPPDRGQIIPAVLTNIWTFSGTAANGVPICDLALLPLGSKEWKMWLLLMLVPSRFASTWQIRP